MPADAKLFGGSPTRVWTYQSLVMKGELESVAPLLDSYAGPIIRAKQGQRVRVHFFNSLPERTDISIIHWHGLLLPENMDAHPRYAIAPGQTYIGERVLVNGQPNFVLPVATRAYRLRVLNGSNARIYKLAWSDGTPLTVIGTDGGLLEQPVQRQYVMLSPGERVELWADFSRRRVGDEFTLDSLEFFGAEDPAEEMKAMMGSMGMAHPFHIHGVQFQVIERQVSPELKPGYDSVRDGYVDEGWKDTILIMPGERVKLLIQFGSNTGLFTYHCHNLEHEDMGMMRNYAAMLHL